MVDGKHVETAQRLPPGKKNEWGLSPIIHTVDELYRIPQNLISDIFSVI